jgi:aryl-alcohol dehydrogenase-like predicted oxidoreductase
MTIELRPLGATGVKVSPLCLGVMMLGQWGNPDHDDGVRLIHRALDRGINFIDTADAYSGGESEEILAKALAGGRRDDVVVATKFHFPMGADPNRQGNSRRWIVRAAEDSLRRLGTDWIDLYQVHRPDPACDLDETLAALTDLVRAGKIRYFGCSTFPAHMIVESHWRAERRALGRFSCEQPPYSILARAVELDVLPVCARFGMGVIPWSPLGAGWLTGRYGTGKEPPPSMRLDKVPTLFDMAAADNRAKLEAVDRLAALADEAGMTLIQMALAFVMAHPAVTAPIIGPRTIEHLDSQLAALDVTLGDDVLDRIDEIVPPGHTFNPADYRWIPPEASEPALRRRRPRVD